jgi:hypothetical protein
MVYDTLRSNMVLFGGTVGPNRGSNAADDRSDTARFQFSAGIRESCTTGYDGDNDGLLGCADPDCWGYCTPECPPDTTPNWPSDCSTAAGVQRCGDGTCDTGVENSRICPGDCSAATPVCGDFICDPAENIGNCPGDCTPAP